MSVRFEQVSTLAWNIKQSYSIGTKVTHNGKNYVSIKNVPVGVNIGMGDYWKKLELKDDVADLADAVEDLQDDVDDIRENVSALESDVALAVYKSVAEIAGNIPTTTELANLTVSKTGTTVIDFVSTNSGDTSTVRSSMVYTRAAANYGAGILFSYYSSGVISYVRNENGTWTITPIELTS